MFLYFCFFKIFQLQPHSRSSPRSPPSSRSTTNPSSSSLTHSHSYHLQHSHPHPHPHGHSRSSSDVPPPLPARNRSLASQISAPNISTSSLSLLSPNSSSSSSSLMGPPSSSNASSCATSPVGNWAPPPLPPRPSVLDKIGEGGHAQSLENIPKSMNLSHVSFLFFGIFLHQLFFSLVYHEFICIFNQYFACIATT